jgi:hypothetical protein
MAGHILRPLWRVRSLLYAPSRRKPLLKIADGISAGYVYDMQGNLFRFVDKEPSGTGSTLDDNTDTTLALMSFCCSELLDISMLEVLLSSSTRMACLGDDTLLGVTMEALVDAGFHDPEEFARALTGEAAKLGFTIKVPTYMVGDAYGLEFCGATVPSRINPVVSTKPDKVFAAVLRAKNDRHLAEICGSLLPLLKGTRHEPAMNYLKRHLIARGYEKQFPSAVTIGAMLPTVSALIF